MIVCIPYLKRRVNLIESGIRRWDNFIVGRAPLNSYESIAAVMANGVVPRISVIVPTYNEEKNIGEFLSQFSKQTIPRDQFELIVSDGDSKDRTRKIASELADAVVIQTSPGIGGARNDGAKVARAPLLATTDADCRVPPNWLEVMLAAFEREGEDVVAVVGQDGPLEKTVRSVFFYYLINRSIYLLSKFGIYCTGGTNSGFRKWAFDKVEGYRNLPYSDDMEIGTRLQKIGRIYYERDLYVALSVRRLEQAGYINTIMTWITGSIKVMRGKEIVAKGEGYAKMEYD